MSRYIYQRTGGPLVQWTGPAPRPARAADNLSLGDCQCQDAARVPKAGAPEYISDYEAVRGNSSALSDVSDFVDSKTGRTAASAVALWHGYKRNQSVGWALVWGALGYVSPVITTVIAAAQGLGHKKGG